MASAWSPIAWISIRRSSTEKERTLTNFYSSRPTWLANTHAALDRAVWDACGWPEAEVPGEVAEGVILSRLPGYTTRGYTPNHERAESPVRRSR